MPVSARNGAAMAVALMSLAMATASADDNYESWPLLKTPFESTGGGGIMIGGYDPIAVSDKCRTDFTATEPGGKVYYNKIEFDVPTGSGRHPLHQRQMASRRRQHVGNDAVQGLHQGRRAQAFAIAIVIPEFRVRGISGTQGSGHRGGRDPGSRIAAGAAPGMTVFCYSAAALRAFSTLSARRPVSSARWWNLAV